MSRDAPGALRSIWGLEILGLAIEGSGRIRQLPAQELPAAVPTVTCVPSGAGPP
jgi:hypothetical protein